MILLQGTSYASILRQALKLLTTSAGEASPRGRPTHEIQHVGIHLSVPSNRYPRLDGRNASIVALIAETIWVMAGRNDLAFIQPYLPRMAEYSDDGIALSGGYGPRIRSWGGIDQMRSIIETLNADPHSRRAVISLFEPAIDHDQTKKDIPCTTSLHFTRSNELLHLSVYSRSMDIMWGSAINFFEWTTLQEAVAFWLGTPVGSYNHFIGSLHIYDEFLERGRRIAQSPDPIALSATTFDIPLDQLDASFAEYFRIESNLRNGALETPSSDFASAWLAEAIGITHTFWTARHTHDFDRARAALRRLPVSEVTAMAEDQLAFMERIHVAGTSGRPSDT